MNANSITGAKSVARPASGSHIGRRGALAHPVRYRTVRVSDIEIDQDVRIFEAKTAYNALNRDVFAVLKGRGGGVVGVSSREAEKAAEYRSYS